jgi:hypothetical protein
MINNERFKKDLESLRLILIDKKIISENESIGVKQFVKYSHMLKYSSLKGLNND